MDVIINSAGLLIICRVGSATRQDQSSAHTHIQLQLRAFKVEMNNSKWFQTVICRPGRRSMRSKRVHHGDSFSCYWPPTGLLNNRWTEGPPLPGRCKWANLNHKVTTLVKCVTSVLCVMATQTSLSPLQERQQQQQLWNWFKSLSNQNTLAKEKYNSHEAQLGLSAYQDLSQALDSSHLHLDLLWGHGALSHGHIWMTWEKQK